MCVSVYSVMSTTPSLIRCLKEGQMDFVGQAQALRFFTLFVWFAGVVGFVYGFFTQRFMHTFAIMFAAAVIGAIICVPSWPCWNRNRIQFQKSE